MFNLAWFLLVFLERGDVRFGAGKPYERLMLCLDVVDAKLCP